MPLLMRPRSGNGRYLKGVQNVLGILFLFVVWSSLFLLIPAAWYALIDIWHHVKGD